MCVTDEPEKNVRAVPILRLSHRCISFADFVFSSYFLGGYALN